MKFFHLIGLLSLCALSACSNGRSAQEANLSLTEDYPITVSIKIDEAVPMDKALKSKQIITFTEDTENIMGIPQNMVVRGDTIYALDVYSNPGIFAYLKNGEQVFAYCHMGSGPGDINMPSCLSVTDDEISTYDGSSYKIVVIGKDGVYRRSIDAPTMSLSAILDPKGDVWADFSNQPYDSVRVSWKAADISDFEPVMTVPELQKGITSIEVEPLQILFDGTVGYMPTMENNLYSLSDGKATLKYHLDFNGVWPDDDEFKAKFTGLDWAPKLMHFPIKALRFQESERFLVIKFMYDKKVYLHILNKVNGQERTIKLDDEMYIGSSYLDDSELYLTRKDNQLEIMAIENLE